MTIHDGIIVAAATDDATVTYVIDGDTQTVQL